ncbi:MAG: transglutaminase domain-containing protein [Dehalococcoidia bacterium]
MIAALYKWLRSGLSSFFSSRIEDSFRLRSLTLAGLWTAALGLVWVGGDLGYCLAGGVLGTFGHWFSYKMRNRPSRLRPLVIGISVVALSIYLRNDMVKSLNGEWLPLGQYLVLISGLAAFDLRTRGGLYTGLVLSGLVLFFASQQAFDNSFGIFVVGFLVVILAFLVLTFLEDLIRSARTYWTKNSVATLLYWTGAISAMFLLAGLAFWVLPRGEHNLAGSPQLAVLPYSENDIRTQQTLQQIEQGNSPLSNLSLDGSSGQTGGTDGVQGDGSAPDGETTGTSGTDGLQNDGSGPTGQTGDRAEEFPNGPQPSGTEATAPVYTGGNSGDPSSAALENLTSSGQTDQAVRDNRSENGEDPVVFHVRSKVASYWRGLVMEDFDGSRWFVSDLNNKMIESARNEGTWYNLENDFSGDNINYHQTFFLRGNDELPMVTGYRALRVTVNDEQSDNALLTSGASYRVISSVPKHTPDQLQRDTASRFSPELTSVPQGVEPRLSELAQNIVAGSSSDFEKMGRIISYLNAETNLAPVGQTGLTSLATLDEFLFQGKDGGVLDYATATVMLARASGMPARLAAGYLPGTRDPLTGTYRVRKSDRHAWAEVLFEKNGWVPFDGAPRGDFSFGQQSTPGLARLFSSGAGEDIYRGLKEGPQEVFRTLVTSLPGPILSALVPAIAVALLIGRWFLSRSRRRLTHSDRRLLSYAALPGDGRREMKKLYAEVERLIRRHVGRPRAAWQTAGDYGSLASQRSPEIDEHISWFTEAIWLATYRSRGLHPEMLTQGRRRLALLKKAFKLSASQETSTQNP